MAREEKQPPRELEVEFSTNAQPRALPAPAEPRKETCVNYPRHPAFTGGFCKHCAKEAHEKAIYGIAADRRVQ